MSSTFCESIEKCNALPKYPIGSDAFMRLLKSVQMHRDCVWWWFFGGLTRAMRDQNRAARKSNGVALGHVSWTLVRHWLMIEVENLKVAVAMFLGESVFAWRGRDSASAWFGATKGGWVMGKWRWTSVHDLKNDATKVRSATMWLQLIPIATPPPWKLFICNQHPPITSILFYTKSSITISNELWTHHITKTNIIF